MILENSEQSLAVVTGTITAKKAIALESYAKMTGTRNGKAETLTLEATGTFQEFSAKINDVFNTLQNIDVDEAELTSTLKEIGRSPRNLYDNSVIMFASPDNVGRINASYIQDFAQDISAVASKIIRGEITSISGTNVGTPVIEGIKRQLVSGTYKGNTSKSCFGELPKMIPYPYDARFINSMAIPFVKNFSAKKAEIASEISAMEKSSEEAFAIVSTISQSKEIMTADTDSRQLLNVYLAAAGTGLVDIVSFATYLIIRKMDIMIANATALNEMYDNARSNGRIRLAAEAAADEETPIYNIENVDTLAGVIRGVCGKIRYDILNYYGETSHPIDDQIITAMRDKYTQFTYPAEAFINILKQKKAAIEKLKDAIATQEYPAPMQLAIDLGLYNNMIPDYALQIEAIPDLTVYENDDLGAADKAFMALAELHALEGIIEKIAMYGNEIAANLDQLKNMSQNPSAMISRSDAVRDEILDVVDAIVSNINIELIPEVFRAIDRKCLSLDSYITQSLAVKQVIVPDLASLSDDMNYVEAAMRSVIADEEIYANARIKAAAKLFRESKMHAVTFFATEAEAPATNAGGATPGNPIATDNAPGSNKSVEVKEDDTKKTDADNAQNAEAASNSKKDPQAFRDSIKKLMDQAMKFFEDMISNFGSTIKSKKNSDMGEYITANKDAILNRSFNGVTLKIPFFPELATANVVKEIGQVTAAVGALNAQSINSSTEDKLAALLFPFADFGTASTSDDRIKAVKERYKGQEGAAKEEFTGAKLRNKTQKMVAFCEEYYVNKKGEEVATALESLKNTTKNMLGGLSSITDMNALPDDAKVKFINRSVKMFAGAITTAYRNQANAYSSALKSLTPKKKASQEAPVAEPSAAEQPAEPQATPAAPTA